MFVIGPAQLTEATFVGVVRCTGESR